MSAPIASWVDGSLASDVRQALQRLADTQDVQHVAVMPDVHLANAVCVGTVTATRTRLFPEAVGGDIGCGMSAVGFDAPADLLGTARNAATVLAGLYRAIPFIKHAVADAPPLPAVLDEPRLSVSALETLKRRDGRLEFGTLGRGNHFIEFQRDDSGGLWLMVHSGSRAMGPAIREHHLVRTQQRSGLRWLDADSAAGAHYLNDMHWARTYARASRALMVDRVIALMAEAFGVFSVPVTRLDCDHNHVQLEPHFGTQLWVHRKGALPAADGQAGVIPGSMGSPSYHVLGRGEPASLCSSSHGAGRCMSRSDARRRISRRRLLDAVDGVWFDHNLTDRLREEAPGAYKDIDTVMRAQHALTRIVRRLEPVLVYKGT